MVVRNVHERELACAATRAGALIDTLASRDDRLWPHDRWPAMRLDRPLQVGAAGGHGPVRYVVEAYEPGRRVRFRFTGPRGFHGWHEFAVHASSGGCRLVHVLEMNARGPARISWPVVYRPLHDALVEDALDRAERILTGEEATSRWSLYVRMLRWSLAAMLARRNPRRPRYEE
jgi:hypothetical protein